MRLVGDSEADVEALCTTSSDECVFYHPILGRMDKCQSCSDSTGPPNCLYGVTDNSACLYGASVGGQGGGSPPPPPPSSSTCTDLECCTRECGRAGYCCNVDYHLASNRLFSCYEGCAMRVVGDARAQVDGLCVGNTDCVYVHPILGRMDKCLECSDSTNTGNCVYGITDTSACLYGSALGDGGGGGNPTPPPVSPSPPPSSGTPAELVYPTSFFWNMRKRDAVSSGGNSWYTGVFNMLNEGYPLQGLQFGLAGTWMVPYPLSYDDCACNPSGDFGCCNPCTYFQTIEGGPGYWGNELATQEAKWRIGGATACYQYFVSGSMFYLNPGYTPHMNPLDCDMMNFIVVSNRVIANPDGFTVAGTGGALGIAWVVTGIGRHNSTDDRNWMTLALDSTNFAGPVGYVPAEVWKRRAEGWESESRYFHDFTNSDGVYHQEIAFEWNSVPSYATSTAYKTPSYTVPVTDGRAPLAASPMSYNRSDTYDQVEVVLETGENNDANIMSQGTPEDCTVGDSDAEYLVGDSVKVSMGSLSTSKEQGECVWSILPNNLTCRDGYTGDCQLPRYFNAQTRQPMDEAQAPQELVSAQFTERKEDPSYAYDAYNYEPAGGCRDTPGPASETVYCIETSSPSWVAFRWYKFVDQPALQVSHLSDAERDYIQARIENLHRGTEQISQWIKPGVADAMGQATLDESQFVTPPDGM
eukprot:CAMPEP_0119122032 /NCGR_PEP_ID=MMETSP1310-20130426/2410_1 /TAXON_ID=464262 /ORGANISM="Genus nov. species nov., Strain RCC2339" /LENGTH=697 /DNA_ID=CAMNT_0007111635 /DNA_START=272 /DNA_END=2362 /DNA_ORIENTATION=+